MSDTPENSPNMTHNTPNGQQRPFTAVRVRHVLFLTAALSLAGMLLILLLTQILKTGFGWDNKVLTGQISDTATTTEVWQLRFVAFLNQALAFLMPALATLFVLRRATPDLIAGVSLQKAPRFRLLLLCMLLMAVTMPLVFYTYQINKMIPVPESFRESAALAENAIKALMNMPDIPTFLANLFLIAVMPAFGEELIFRGILQRQLMRRMNPWPAILIAGALFSLMHFQMDGFLPRWLLGVLLGWTYWKTNNFWVPVLLHFLNNGVQVFAQFLYGQKTSPLDLAENDIQIPVGAALFSVAAAYWVYLEIEKTIGSRS